MPAVSDTTLASPPVRLPASSDCCSESNSMGGNPTPAPTREQRCPRGGRDGSSGTLGPALPSLLKMHPARADQAGVRRLIVVVLAIAALPCLAGCGGHARATSSAAAQPAPTPPGALAGGPIECTDVWTGAGG